MVNSSTPSLQLLAATHVGNGDQEKGDDYSNKKQVQHCRSYLPEIIFTGCTFFIIDQCPNRT